MKAGDRGIGRRWAWGGLLAAIAVALASAGPGQANDEFEVALSRVDKALRTNPRKVPSHALYSCQDRRRHAVLLYRAGEDTRARRSLRYCFQVLGVPEQDEPVDLEAIRRKAEARAAAAAKRAREKSADEVETALALEPDLESGLEIYRDCALCHTPEGWGLSSGVVPQLAGQHRKVIIKQMADFRAGNRDNQIMVPYSSFEAIGGAQAVADVAGYIDTLEISVENGRGPGKDLALGEKLYKENCLACHGERGEGDNDRYMPRIQAQHYRYLVTQFEWIRDGKRRNSNAEMTAQIKGFDDRQISAVLDYVSRLEPDEALQAPPGWRNPDFMQPPALPDKVAGK